MTRYPYPVDIILRYCRQVVLKTADYVRARMRGSDRLELKQIVDNHRVKKSQLNLTTAIDREAEDLAVDSLVKKLGKISSIRQFTIFSEELGIRTFPKSAKEKDSDLIFFIDPIDGTEFIEALQGGWCLMSVYDRRIKETIVAVAGDIFLDRLFWASKDGYAEGLDFTTHSWFRLDGGSNPKDSLEGARVNFLTTKVSRFRAVAKQERLLDAIEKNDGRINLAWGSNMIIQVAAGYADAAVEFAKGFAAYDILPGLFIGSRAGLTILHTETRKPLPQSLDIEQLFQGFLEKPDRPLRTPFVATCNPELANRILDLLHGGSRS